MLEIQLSLESTCLVCMRAGFDPHYHKEDGKIDTETQDRQTWTETVRWGVCGI